jgi:hypothetical protein
MHCKAYEAEIRTTFIIVVRLTVDAQIVAFSRSTALSHEAPQLIHLRNLFAGTFIEVMFIDG